MATIRRIGFGTVFELEDSKVGIGTDAATHTLQALGNIRSEAATDIGISSLTTYQGFTDKEARFTTGQIDNQNVPKLRVKNGVLVGIGPNGSKGEYINQIAFRKSTGTFYKWDGTNWVTVSDVVNYTEATKLFRQRDEFKEANESNVNENIEKEKVRLSAYKTAI